MACESRPHPLQRSGTSQAERHLPGLAPDYVRIDEKRPADWMVFASEFARYLRFHTASGTESPEGWKAFFSQDLSAILGNIAVQSIDTWRTRLGERLQYLRDDDHQANEGELKKSLSECFAAVAALARALDSHYLRLPEDLAYKTTLRQTVQTQWAPALHRLIGYIKAADSLGLRVTISDEASSWKILGQPLEDASALLTATAGLSSIWWTANTPDASGVAADASVYHVPYTPGEGMPSEPSLYARVSHAASHFLFTSVFDSFTEGYARLISEAEAALIQSLEAMDNHAPHYTLFLTFLKLYRIAQQRLNGLLWKHLDHYYKDILRLKPKAAEPDHVHLVAELAKATTSASLPAGTLFKAGKDSQGKEVFYALDRDTTFNKAEVASLLSLFEATPPFQGPASSRVGFAVASHYLFLAEGVRTLLLRFGGTDFSALPAGKLLCYLTHAKGWLEKAPHAVRASAFSEGGGCTEIEIHLDGGDPALVAWDAKVHGGGFQAATPVVQCLLRPEAGQPSDDYDLLKNVVVDAVEVVVKVGRRNATASQAQQYDDAGAKLILAANGAGNLDVSKPFQPWGAMPAQDMPFILGHAEVFTKANAAFNLHIDWANRPNTISPSPKVKLQFLQGGIWKDCDEMPHSVGTSGALYASAKPKQKTFADDVNVPGAALQDWREAYSAYQPDSRSGFMRFVLEDDFGQEAYQMALTEYLIQQATKAAHKVTADEIIDITKEIVTGVVSDVAEETLKQMERVTLNVASATQQMVGQVANAGVNMAHTMASEIAKAMKLKIPDKPNVEIKPVDIKTHIEEKTGKLTNVATSYDNKLFKYEANDFTSGLPEKPYLPTIAGLYLSYTASSHRIELNPDDVASHAQRSVNLFQVGPFGEAEAAYPRHTGDTHALVPQFRLTTGADTRDHVAQWMIGFRHLAPGQGIDVLVQIQEGSTDPTLIKPEKHVIWSYWSRDRWKPFQDRHVSDGTSQLIQSGLVRFAIPDDATLDAGIMPHGLLWVMASVSEAIGAVGKILAIHAQAMQATLVMPGIADDYLNTPLPAGAISKLKDADSRFKKFSQPFASFGGRSSESGDRFYLRSSERLRHKGRAVTLWDYETLVLEAFPSLYKVKCLSHTRIEVGEGDNQAARYSENAPGHVTLIALPAVSPSTVSASDSDNDAPPPECIKPYTRLETLVAIRDFLRERVTGQLAPGAGDGPQVHVCNPLYEEIILEFSLSLKEGFHDFTWYARLLQVEITRHLAPWAYGKIENEELIRSDSETVPVQFGGRVAKSSLIHFIEERPYVDFITNVVMKHRVGDNISGDVEEAVATTARSILTSAHPDHHTIVPHPSTITTSSSAAASSTTPITADGT